MILIVDFGSQYTELLVKKIRNMEVFAEVMEWEDEKLLGEMQKYQGLIISGSPDCSKDEKHENIIGKILDKCTVPIMAICYGMQVIHKMYGGELTYGTHSEFGDTLISLMKDNVWLDGIPISFKAWMSHNDSVIKPGKDFVVLGKSNSCISLSAHKEKKIFTTQFHPEVEHSYYGEKLIKNFVFLICKVQKNWKIRGLIENKVEEISEKVGRGKVFLGLSGGLDSSVVAELLKRSGCRYEFIYVDTGFNSNEHTTVAKEYFGKGVANINASKIFFEKLKGITSPEEKRKIIGETFAEVFEGHIEKHGEENYFLAQGTIHSDLIESGKKNKSHKIKTHHNTIANLGKKFNLVEPIKELFKSEVRVLAKELNLPDFIINAKPFPGPGYAVRIIGEVTEEKVEIVSRADQIIVDQLRRFNMYKYVDQVFAVLLDTKTVGVVGDQRKYGYVIAIRSVNTQDFMTAKVSEIPLEMLMSISSEITNSIEQVVRVVYDVTSKPPGAIEWE